MTEELPDSTRKTLQKLSDSDKVKYLAAQCWQLREKDTKTALCYGKYAVHLIDSLNITEYAAKANNYLGVIYIHYNYDTPSAIPYFHKGLEFALRQNDSTEIGYSYNNLGDAFYLAGNTPLALDYAEKSLNIFNKLSDTRGIAYSYINLGLLYRYEKQYDLALEYFFKSIELRQTIDFNIGIASALLEVARTYYEKGDYEQALKYFNESLGLHIRIDNKRYMAFCLNGIGDVYYQTGRYYDALKMFDESLKLNIERKHYYGIIDNRLGKALVYSQLNERNKGESELNAAIKTADELAVSPKILQAYETATEFYMNLNDHKSASESFNRCLFRYDSLFSRQQFETLKEIEDRYHISQELEEINYELEIRKKDEIYLIVIILLMMILVTVFIWKYLVKRDLSKKLQLINDSKDKLFSIISHDLKNPFTALVGYIELLQHENLTEEERTEYINDLETTTKNTYSLLENLLYLSASRTGKIGFNPKRFSLTELIQNLAASMLIMLKNKSIKLNLDLGQNEIFADSQMVEIIIRNLITNAIKFCNENGIVTIKSELRGDNFIISISDNGIGMDKATTDNLFASDFVSSHRGTAGEKGTGLGLSLCNEFVQKHGGEIKVKSEPGKGSEFVISLPQITNN